MRTWSPRPSRSWPDTAATKAEARKPRTQGAGLIDSTCPAAQRLALRAFPFGGSRTAGRCTVQVTLPGTASHEGSVLLGVLSAAGLRGISGSPHPPRPRHFCRVQRICPTAIRRELSHAASSSLELSASSRVLQPTTCPRYPGQSRDRPEARERLPWGSSSLIATSAGDVHYCPGFPHPELTVRPRRFTRPRRFAPPPALRVCFAPQPRPGFALQGFVPPAEPYRLSPAESCPLAVGWRRLRFDPRRRPHRRLQGLAPRGECGDGGTG
jgi:hypothetical protein